MSYDKPGNLQHGAPLEIEDLDVSGLGLYTQEQKDKLLAEGAEDDFFPAEEIIGRWGVGYLARKSDEGKKRHTFYDKDIKLHKDIK